jgi:cellulose synthase/poly-beta-1,6-N-acetylglucosamine synthase-like glycosyltransferase
VSVRSAKKETPYTAAVRAAAIRAFRERHPGLQLTPVVAVIAALDEEGAVGGVVDAVPAEACGLAVSTLVVDDGSTDGTAAVARDHGAYVARLERNCGHGVALRVGYELARRHGAEYLVTLDGDFNF